MEVTKDTVSMLIMHSNTYYVCYSCLSMLYSNTFPWNRDIARLRQLFISPGCMLPLDLTYLGKPYQSKHSGFCLTGGGTCTEC